MANDATRTNPTDDTATTATPMSKAIAQFTAYDSIICGWWVVVILLLLPLAGLIAPAIFTAGTKTTIALVAGTVLLIVWKWDFRKIEMAVAGLLLPGLLVLVVYAAATNVEWMGWIPDALQSLNANDPTLLACAGLLALLMAATAIRDRITNTWQIQGAELVNAFTGKRISVSAISRTGNGYSVQLLTASAGAGDYMEYITTLGRTGEVVVGDHVFARVFRAKAVADAINQAAQAAARQS